MKLSFFLFLSFFFLFSFFIYNLFSIRDSTILVFCWSFSFLAIAMSVYFRLLDVNVPFGIFCLSFFFYVHFLARSSYVNDFANNNPSLYIIQVSVLQWHSVNSNISTLFIFFLIFQFQSTKIALWHRFLPKSHTCIKNSNSSLW